MKIRRLGWAGIEVEAGGQRLGVDVCTSFGDLEQYVGPPLTELPAPRGEVDIALITHMHRDHADPSVTASTILRPSVNDGEFLEVAATVSQDKVIEGETVAPWETRAVGPFSVTAVPAVDGFGDPQVSWVVEADGRRVLHCGDTLFHGFWWKIRMRCGPFDAVFLPANGATCQFPHRQPASPFVADMDPEQAAVAAAILEAPVAVPIHYDAIHHPPVYAQVDDPAGRFERACPVAQVVEVGEEVAL